MESGNQVFNSYKLLSQREALIALDEYQLKDLLSNASRKNVRAMLEFSLTDIRNAIEYMGIDTGEGAKGLGDKRKKTTFVKMAIQTLSVFHIDDIDEAIDQLSFALGIQDDSLDDDEREQLENYRRVAQAETEQPKVEAVALQPEQIKPALKKVTKAELQAKKQKRLNSQAPEIRWECDFAGEVSIGKEVREFWVADPYTEAVVNLVTSNETVILSAWESTKENPFMRAVVREFHELLATRGNTDLIENRLMTIALRLQGSKKRADWHVQSHEALVLIDGKKMESREGGQYLYVLNPFENVDLSEGTAYIKSQQIARDYPDRYNYVEGFALVGQKLIHHAWVFDKRDNKAVEITFKDKGIQHLGIVLDIEWVDKVIASRLKDDSISPRFSQSIIEGNFLDDFKFLKSGLKETAIAW